MTQTDDRLAVGGNNPPPFEAYSMALDDAYATAKDFLDGAPVETQGQADAIGRIVAEVKKLRKDADAARADEKRPHDDAGKAVQAMWKPLLDRADNITAAAQKPLTAYLLKLEAEQRAMADAARVLAEMQAAEAIAASRAAESLDDIEAAAELEKSAEKANREANKTEKAKAHITGLDRAIGLRSYRIVNVTDRRAALNWIARNDADALAEFITEYANKCRRDMDGVEVTTERRVA